MASIFQDLKDDHLRDYEDDTLSVLDWLEGSYPNFFFTIDIDDVENFTTSYAKSVMASCWYYFSGLSTRMSWTG